jgi:hypothetical protein
MSLTSEFQNAVRSWEQTPRPFENFRASRGSALTYGIECDLDHQASYLETMIRQWHERNPHWDFRMRAENELRDLTEYQERIEALELPDGESGPLLRYVFATRLLLETIAEMATHELRE